MSGDLEDIFRGLPQRRRVPQTFGPGGVARIRAGAFAAFTGRIEGINQSKRLLKVRVEIFGRESHIGLGFADVETVSFH